jgi:AcrR family transcriptional regulator
MSAPPRPRPGRPRDKTRDALILDATMRLIARDGYTRMTLRQIAAEAGVSKATIYLRWSDKADLATAAIEHARLAESPAPTGDTRADLLAQLRWFRATQDRIFATGLVGTCLMEEHHTPELLQLLRERAVQPRWKIMRAILQAAVDNGELDPGADLDTLSDLLHGAFYAQYLRGETPADDRDARVVDAVLAAGRAA